MLKSFWEKFVEFLRTRQVLHTSLEDFLVKAIFAAILILAIVWLLPSERPFEYRNLTVGSIAREEIIAPFTFPILKTEDELKAERRKAWLSVPRVFDYRPGVLNKQLILLKLFFTELKDFFRKAGIADTIVTTQPPLLDQTLTDSLIQEIFLKYNLNLSSDQLNALAGLYAHKRLDSLHDYLAKGFAEVYSQGVLDRGKDHIPEQEVAIIKNGEEENVATKEVLDATEAATHIYNLLQNVYSGDAPENEIASYLIPAFLIPNLVYNEDLTQERKEKAVHDVPQTRGFVYENQRIVGENEIITPEIYRKLQSMAVALRERADQTGKWKRVKFYTGKYLFAIFVLLIPSLFLFFFRHHLIRDNKLLGMITLIFLIQFILTSLIGDVLQWHHYSIPVILAPMLLSMLLDASVAFVGTVSLSLIMGAYQGNDYAYGFMTLIVGTIALYSVQKIRNRGQMFRAILMIAVAYFFVNLTFGLLHFDSTKNILTQFSFYLLPNSIFTPTAVFMLIGIFERLFDVTTDITLLELSDMNHPLLKRLSVEAPGTFHHSIIVGNLAESAAKAIGANALLARVGCYYHDIGKMLKPEYFVENQMGAMNKHETLSPHMSTLILINHVKAGLELAEQYGLPRAVKQFIPEHHGTSLITYFYRKALEISEPSEINEDDFRYPGPRPQSRETAIAMLADTVEAASRTLQNPTPQRIRGLVNSLVEKKISESQLDECDLTLREIKKIKEAFIHILMGIHHLRIEYPVEAAATDGSEEQTQPVTPSGTAPQILKAKKVRAANPDGNNIHIQDNVKTTPHGNKNRRE